MLEKATSAAKATALGHEVECIEIQAGLADVLKASGLYAKVICADFLQQQPGPDRVYDRIIMNPPFDRELDVEHVSHALRFLSEDGLLVAIMSAGTEYRSSAAEPGLPQPDREHEGKLAGPAERLVRECGNERQHPDVAGVGKRSATDMVVR